MPEFKRGALLFWKRLLVRARAGSRLSAMAEIFIHRSHFDVPAEELFRWHALPGALERLTPPWEPLKVIQPAPGIRDGHRGILQVSAGPFPMRWTFEHRDYEEGRQFRDVMTSGPFKRWEHTHRFIPDGESACWLEDRVEYELPLGWLGRMLGGWFVRRKLSKLFKYRHEMTARGIASARKPSMDSRGAP
jgi:ligand-binding SRPBCC domain-containing protein